MRGDRFVSKIIKTAQAECWEKRMKTTIGDILNE